MLVVRYEKWKAGRERVRRQKQRKIESFWQLGLALVVIRKIGNEKEREIRQNKASPRKRKAPLYEKNSTNLYFLCSSGSVSSVVVDHTYTQSQKVFTQQTADHIPTPLLLARSQQSFGLLPSLSVVVVQCVLWIDCLQIQ